MTQDRIPETLPTRKRVALAYEIDEKMGGVIELLAQWEDIVGPHLSTRFEVVHIEEIRNILERAGRAFANYYTQA